MPEVRVDRFVVTVDVAFPELGNNTADAERLKIAFKRHSGIDGLRIPLSVIRQFPRNLRRWGHRVKCVIFKTDGQWELLGVSDPEIIHPALGLAVDIGTTRVAIELVDLETGVPIAETGFDNPQTRIAPDVLARIHYAGQQAGLAELQELIVDEISKAADRLCRDKGYEKQSIYLVAAAGNTSMGHLFLGIDPGYMIREPYIPAVNAPEPYRAEDLGLSLNPEARVFLFPNIGAYFGGDLISGLLYSKLYQSSAPCIMVDVGTNAEVVVGCRDWLMACAGAAGPALEGGMSDMGMAAGSGVIDRVMIDPVTTRIEIHTIDDAPPIGICGSGMIDIAAGLFLSGMLDIRGRFSPERCGKRLINVNDIPSFVLVDKKDSGTGSHILLSQVDMNSLTSSKAAMHSILEVIVKQNAGLTFEDLSTFYVAGTFGSFINPRSAIAIGMLPDIPVEKFTVLGNSSLKGAAMLLADPASLDEIKKIQEMITYIELNVNAEFMNIFSGAKFYPHTDQSRFPSVKPFLRNGQGLL